jgi:WD40 repeat protein
MIKFFMGSKLTWEEYLKTTSLSKDLSGQIRRSSKQERMAISEQTREIVASREALLKKFSSGFDTVNGTLEWGFGRVEHAINGVTASVQELRASFDYNLALVIEQLQLQNQTMLHVLQQMEAIHATLENPTLTMAREFYRIGCERLMKGLLDKALEAFLESAKKDDTNFMTQLAIGKLYLYGVNEECNVIDLKKAEYHLRAAARYSKAETKRFAEAPHYAGEALLHAAIACYAQANEQLRNGNTAEAHRFLEASYQLARESSEVHPQLSEGHYHQAKFAALLGDGKTAVACLERAIAIDDDYCLKADSDLDFRFVFSDTTNLYKRLRQKSADELRPQIQKIERLLTDWIYTTVEAKQAETEIRQILSEAENSLQRNTYFDNRDSLRLMQNAEQIFQSLLVYKLALQTLSAHFGCIRSLAFSPDQKLLASGGAESVIRIWKLEDNQPIFLLRGHTDGIVELMFSHDGHYLVSVDKKGGVKLWNVADGSLIYDLLRPVSPVHCIAFSPDDTKLAIGGYNREATVWDLSDGSLIHTLNGHKSSVDTVVFSSNGKYLATGSPDNTAWLWGVEKGHLLHTFYGCSGLANCLAFGSDDSVLITGSNNGSVRFYQVRDGKLIHTLPERSGTISWLTLSPNRQILATLNYGKALQLWDVENDNLLFNLKPFSPGITSVSFSPDGMILAANDYQDRSVKMWSVQNGKLMHVIAGNLTCSAFSPDGTILVTGDEAGSLKFWGRMVTPRETYEQANKRKARIERTHAQELKQEPVNQARVHQVKTMRQPRNGESFHPAPVRRAQAIHHEDHRRGMESPKQPSGQQAGVYAEFEQRKNGTALEPELEASAKTRDMKPEPSPILTDQQSQFAIRIRTGRCLECGRKLGFFAKLRGIKYCREHSFYSIGRPDKAFSDSEAKID